MLTINQPLEATLSYPFLQYPIQDLLFFDIETTGFSASTSSLYLIGCVFFENNHWQLTQWFADDYESEDAILKNFFSLCRRFRILIHYNGNGFDIPYLKAKIAAHDLPYSFDQIESFDLYQKILPYKALFSLPNLKQKTLEEFFCLKREDTHNGGELIKVYAKYMVEKYTRKEDPQLLLDALLLHNKCDLTGLVSICQILHYTDLFSGSLPFQKMEFDGNYACFYCETPGPLAKRIQYTKHNLTLHAFQKQICVKVPTKEAEMKHFLSPYKDYYYLPKEDMAIHKDVAVFVDKEHREKAKACNCYVKKAGTFLPLPAVTAEIPCFYDEYGSKEPYLLMDDAFRKDTASQSRYVNTLLTHFF